jgi:hypothetical protein
MTTTTIRPEANTTIDAVGAVAANAAMRSAADYFRIQRVTVTDFGRATDLIKAHCKLAVSAALDDSRDAIECGMTDIAVATFRATFIQAGIAAAKEYIATM